MDFDEMEKLEQSERRAGMDFDEMEKLEQSERRAGMDFLDQGDLIASAMQSAYEMEECEQSEKRERMMNYDSDTIISIMQGIDKLIDERREMIETIADLQTRAAAHTQDLQPLPNSGSYNPSAESLLSELCAALGWQGGTRHDALNSVRELVDISKRCEDDANYHQ